MTRAASARQVGSSILLEGCGRLRDESPTPVTRYGAERGGAYDGVRAVDGDGEDLIVGGLGALAEELGGEPRAPVVARLELGEERRARLEIEALRLDRVEVERPFVDRAAERLAVGLSDTAPAHERHHDHPDEGGEREAARAHVGHEREHRRGDGVRRGREHASDERSRLHALDGR